MTDPMSAGAKFSERRTLQLGLMLTVSSIALLAAMPASAQSFYGCGTPVAGTSVSCTVPSGANTDGVYIYSTTGSQATYNLTNDAEISASNAGEGTIITLYLNGGNGANGSSDDSPDGIAGGNITITNNAALTLNGGSTTSTWNQVIAIDARSVGGNGVEPHDSGDDGGRGGDGGDVTINNSGALTISGAADGAGRSSVVGINAGSYGGSGGTQGNSDFSDEKGGNGGDGKTVSLTNSGDITIGSSGDYFRGTNQAWGIGIGGGGGGAGTDNGNGGSGPAPTVNNSGDISLYWDGADATADGVVGIRAHSTGNNGTASFDNSDPGGNGEQGKEINITNSGDITLRVDLPGGVQATSDFSAGIYANSTGGVGGTSSDKNTGGAGGNGSQQATGTGNGVTTVTHQNATIDVAGPGVMGMVARSAGGNGGNGNGDSDSTGGNAGYGGQVQMNLYGSEAAPGAVVTAGNYGYGILGQSIGGIGGGDAGTAGAGGNASKAGVYAIPYTSVTTSGDFANGITTHSVGGGGGIGGDFVNVLAGAGGTGGKGGNAGIAEITTAATITTTGDNAVGGLAQTIGGSGGAGGIGTGLVVSLGGEGGAGGQGSDALINNTGTVTTYGYGSDGLLAQSLAGGGGSAGTSVGGAIGVGGKAGDSGSSYGGGAQVTSNDDVTTHGDASSGIVAQAIGGGGGSGKGTTGIFAIGGSGSAGGAGGTAAVYAVGGTVSTAGEFSHGVIAQSIGGGGGNGGNVLDITIGTPALGVGGSGSGGGNGGTACFSNDYGENCGSVSNDTPAPQGSHLTIATQGDYAIGAMAQSVGGGGGNGGSATGAGAFSVANVQVGGSSSGGGSGGSSAINLDGFTLTTDGNNAIGLLAQSIGGGGGNGGSATGYTGESLVPVQVGGSAGGGGGGGGANLGLTTGGIATLGTHAMGVVAQSVGGGGGTGGAASGKNASIGFTFVSSVGRSGGNGGSGGTADAALSDVTVTTGIDEEGNVVAAATDSIGVVVQSIGGGGGLGGASVADAVAVALPDFEGESFAAETSVAVGGKGGTGGNGGNASARLSGASAVVTGGDGSYGVLVQSVGGGGGNAGGADAMSATIGDVDTYSFKGTAAVGNDGGGGGYAGTVSIDLQNSAGVTTYGDYANALMAQSIAGGGGNAGVGSAGNKQLGGGFAVDATLSLGGSGGSGGAGGSVTVDTDAGTAIETHGSGARGVLAQSIGGGGGTATGGTVGLSFSEGAGGGDDDEEDGLSAAATVSVGYSGGSGLAGGAVTVSAYGDITTTGDDADAIHAQSIGGGGGLGGSVGNDAGSDGSSSDDDDDEMDFTGTVAVGGTGGSGSNGGTVDVTVGRIVNTSGDFADGVVAQSIGGGGGAGGTAAAEGSSSKAQITVGVGGSGGAGGAGGTVTANLDDDSGVTGITTQGRHAYGVLLQSIGGGGGQGGDGSQASSGEISVGGGVGGKGGSSGNGGDVTIGDGTWASITTRGDDSFAIVAQSVGGGGGIGAAGTAEGAQDSGNYSLDVAVGGAGGSSGSGGTVNLTLGGSINTYGDRSFGIVAQSIGGGGGIGGSADGENLASVTVGGQGGSAGQGGTVTLDYTAGSITTRGDGAHAIIAQSIGGGGGIGGDASGGLLGVRGFTPTQNTGSGGASAVTVTVDADIQTSGANAYGIIAQSIGGGGGITGGPDGVTFGSNYNGGNVAGTVTVNQSGTIHTSGAGSVGIFAQSQASDNDQKVSVSVDGSVTGGTGTDGVGVFVSGGDSNIMTIAEGGSVSSGDADALALRYDGEYPTQYGANIVVQNFGTVNGDFEFLDSDGAVAGNFDNEAGATYNPTGTSVGNLNNYGTMNLATANAATASADVAASAARAAPAGARVAAAFDVFQLTGDFTQGRTGTILATADFAGRSVTGMTVTGDVALDGTVEIGTETLVKDRAVTLIRAGGRLTGEIEAVDSRFVDFEAVADGRRVNVAAVDSRFADGFEGLSANERAAGRHLDAIFDARARRYAKLLGDLNTLSADDDFGIAYARMMSSLTIGASQAMAAVQPTLARARLDGAMRCRVMFGTADIPDDSCAWATGNGDWTDQSGDAGYDGTLWGMGAGAQVALGDAWTVGGSLGFENGDYDAANGLSSADGTTGYLAAAVGREFGAFSLTGAVSASYGAFDTDRTVILPGVVRTATGDTDVATVGGRLRAAYRMQGQVAYLQPMLDLDLIYTHAGGYKERGAGIYNLDVDAADEVAFIARPSVEVGARRKLGEGLLLGGFASAGVSLSTQDSWETDARLAAAPAGAGDFTSALPVADVLGHVAVGVELSHVKSQFDARIEYNGAFGDDYQSHGGLLRLTKHF